MADQFFIIIPKVKPEVAIDANGGHNRLDPPWGGGAYYFSTIRDNTANDNLLWRLEPTGGFIRIIPKVKQVALDANGGRNFPVDKGGGADAYFNTIQTNDNLLWRLQQVEGYYRIIPKVNQQVALDANGGRNRPDNHGGGAAIYFNTIQDNEGDDNLLWRVQLHHPVI